MKPAETPFIIGYGGLLTDHFRKTKTYSAYRKNGTTDWLLILTHSGRGRFRWKGGQFITRKGDLILLQPGTFHDYGLVVPGELWDLQWVHFFPASDWLPWLKWPQLAPGMGYCRAAEPAVFRRLTLRFEEMRRLSLRSLKNRETLAMNALEEILLWCHEVLAQTDSRSIDLRIRKAVDLLNDLQDRSISSPELATRVGLSVSRLAHLFESQVGMPPRRYWESRRLDQARQLLTRTQLPVGEVARQVGFENQFYFSLRFKKATGLPPLAYRRKAPSS
jgi:AraC family transcriptional regulator of arabinose operon